MNPLIREGSINFMKTRSMFPRPDNHRTSSIDKQNGETRRN